METEPEHKMEFTSISQSLWKINAATHVQHSAKKKIFIVLDVFETLVPLNYGLLKVVNRHKEVLHGAAFS